MRFKKYIIVPLALLVYATVMGVYGWKDYVAAGEETKFMLICGGELLVIIILFFVLRHLDRERVEQRRRRQSSDRRSLL